MEMQFKDSTKIHMCYGGWMVVYYISSYSFHGSGSFQHFPTQLPTTWHLHSSEIESDHKRQSQKPYCSPKQKEYTTNIVTIRPPIYIERFHSCKIEI